MFITAPIWPCARRAMNHQSTPINPMTSTKLRMVPTRFDGFGW